MSAGNNISVAAQEALDHYRSRAERIAANHAGLIRELVEEINRSPAPARDAVEEMMDDVAADLKGEIGAMAANNVSDFAAESAISDVERWITDNIANASLDERVVAVLWARGIEEGVATIRDALQGDVSPAP